MVIKTNAATLTGNPLPSHPPDSLATTLARLVARSRTVPAHDLAIHQTASILFQDRISRTSVAQQDLRNAIVFSQAQQQSLIEVAQALSQMSELCTLALDSETSQLERKAHNSEFLLQQARINVIARTELHQTRLFGDASQVIAIDEDSGTFLTSEVSLESPPYAALNSASLLTTHQAAAAMQCIRESIAQLAKNTARVEANISTLAIASGDIEVRRENLSAPRPRNSRHSRSDSRDPRHRTRYTVLAEAGSAMLAQISRIPDSALRLGGGPHP